MTEYRQHSKMISGFVLAIALASSAAAAQPPVQPPITGNVGENGSIVAVDRATGRLRPATASEIRGLQRQNPPLRANGALMPRDETEAVRTLRPLPGGGYEMQMPISLIEPLKQTIHPVQRDTAGHPIVSGAASTKGGQP